MSSCSFCLGKGCSFCRVYRALILAAALLASGCGNAYSPVASSGTEQEAWILAETARIAGVLNVRVHGELTDHVYSPGEGQVAAGWYEGGVAYYYRPWVVKQELWVLTDVAAHEVCHAKSFNHDVEHWECMAKLATPTYPFPEVKP